MTIILTCAVDTVSNLGAAAAACCRARTSAASHACPAASLLCSSCSCVSSCCHLSSAAEAMLCDGVIVDVPAQTNGGRARCINVCGGSSSGSGSSNGTAQQQHEVEVGKPESIRECLLEPLCYLPSYISCKSVSIDVLARSVLTQRSSLTPSCAHSKAHRV